MAKILIVEDDNLLLKMYSRKLSGSGYEVKEAVNGQEGLDAALSEKPDLILLDIRMPVMTGLEMLKALRKNEWGKSVPVIILTNLEANDQITWDIVKTEPAYYLMKAGNRPDVVLEKIKEVLKEEEPTNKLD